MSIRMRRPETVKLEISQGDWLLVRKHLTAGEQRRIFARMIRSNGDGAEVDPIMVGHSKIMGYLLDWSVQDADGNPVVIKDEDDEVIASALDALDIDSFKEILKAVETHDAEMEKARAAEKNGLDGAIESSATSPSAG